MNINFFYPKQTGYEIGLIKKCLKSKLFNEGKITKLFEKKICFLTNRKYSICTTSGTAAISLSLLAYNISSNDEIIIPSFTYIATANAVSFIKAKPVLVDINKSNACIEVKEILNKITERTKAIITVEVNGRCPDYEVLKKICKKKNIILITDSTEALGSKYKSMPLGSYGDISCFSFSPSKIISTGQGGAIVTNSYKIFRKIMLFKKQGILNGTGGNDIHKHQGFNFKYTDIQSSIGLAQLKHFKKRIKNFNKRNSLYEKHLNNTQGIIFLKSQKGALNLWFDIIVKDLNKLNYIKKEFIKKRVQFRSFWHTLNKHTSFKNKNSYKVSEYISKHGIWLPSNFDINERQIVKICRIIKKSFV